MVFQRQCSRSADSHAADWIGQEVVSLILTEAKRRRRTKRTARGLVTRPSTECSSATHQPLQTETVNNAALQIRPPRAAVFNRRQQSSHVRRLVRLGTVFPDVARAIDVHRPDRTDIARPTADQPLETDHAGHHRRQVGQGGLDHGVGDSGSCAARRPRRSPSTVLSASYTATGTSSSETAQRNVRLMRPIESLTYLRLNPASTID